MMITYWLVMLLFLPEVFISGTTEMPAATGVVQVANQNFIQVDGSSLKAKMDAAIRLGRANAHNGQFWVAYQFDVKPDVMIEGNYDGKKGEHGAAKINRTASNNVGVFMLYNASGEALSRVEVYNLDRSHDFGGHAVYWLGRATNDESLNVLREIIEKEPADKIAERATMALAIHNDNRIGQMLESIVRTVKSEGVRKSAVFWLGQSEGETSFLADLIRNEQESVEIRKQAAFAIGVSGDAMAVNALQGLFQQVTHREVKKQIVFAAFVNKHSDNAVDFLIQVAAKDPEREVRKQALFWLGQKAGQRTLDVLGDTVERNDEDTEVQKQAVFAISQRKTDEAVPMLIKIAKTHPKAEVRKQALFWLGQKDDERALEVFKEILSK